MIFGKFGIQLGSSNLDLESNQIGWERAKAIFESFFSLIEAGVVLGALRAAMSQLDSWTLTALWISGYTALALYVLTGASYFVAASYAHFGWSGENRWVKRSFRTITALIALAVPYVVDGLASQAITAALK